MIIIAIVAVILLVGFFALINLMPHKKAGTAQIRPQTSDRSAHPNETRAQDMN